MAETAEKKVTALRPAETARAEDAVRARPMPIKARDRTRRRQLVRWSLLLGGPALVLVAVGWFWLTGGRYVGTDNAYVQADTVQVATDVAGLVKSIAVGDDQHVMRGQILFTLDDAPYRAALASAEAQIRMAATELEALKASYAKSAADIEQARSDVAFYEKEHARQVDLAGRRVSAQAQLDAARHNLDAARARVSALEQEQASIAAQLNGDPTAPIEQHPRYLAAVAAKDRAAHDLDSTVVRASIEGMTARVSALQPGEYLDAGQAAFALVGTERWIEANPKETRPDLGPARAAGRGVRRHLSRPPLGGHGGERQPGQPGPVLAAAGAEHERQLGQGGAAHPDADRGRAGDRTRRRCGPG